MSVHDLSHCSITGINQASHTRHTVFNLFHLAQRLFDVFCRRSCIGCIFFVFLCLRRFFRFFTLGLGSRFGFGLFLLQLLNGLLLLVVMIVGTAANGDEQSSNEAANEGAFVETARLFRRFLRCVIRIFSLRWHGLSCVRFVFIDRCGRSDW